MSLLSLASILLRIAATLWSLVLAYRFRDLRILVLSATLALSILQPMLTTRDYGELADVVREITLLAVSVLSLAVLAYLRRVFALNARLEDLLRAKEEAEEAKRASEVKFATAFRSSPNVIVLNSHPEGRILDVNDTFVELSGWQRDEVVGRTTRDLDMWGHLVDRQKMMRILQEHGQIRGMEMQYRIRSGEVRPALLSTAVIQVDGQTCLLSTMEDTTELRRVADEREAFIRELEAKNAELEHFTYTVSHDLKSPLVTIQGFLGLVEKEALAGDTERLHRDLDRIRSAADTMGDLLEDLLELSRIGRLVNPSEEVDLGVLTREAIELVRGRIDMRGAEVEIISELPVVWGDRPRILEVVQNLVDNAVKFVPEGKQPKIEIGTRQAEGEIACFVRDNGIGFDPQYQEKIFELFERLDAGVEGTGVGLTLVKRIVELHGGRVWAESEGTGTGAVFYFTLPTEVEATSDVTTDR